MSTVTLRRSIGLPLLTFYGLGTILGAGIYVLIGEVATKAGMATPGSFVLAALLAGTTAFSFAELSSRIPKAAGTAAYVEAAFSQPILTATVGWAVIIAGLVAGATLIRGFVGYLDVFIAMPPWLIIVILVALLGATAAWGIGESLGVAAAITIIEIGGLVFVCVTAGDAFGRLGTDSSLLIPALDGTAMAGIASGAFIAFYAFLGFEDMVNIAEEVRDAERTLPTAIIFALIISTALYVLVAVVAVLAVPIGTLTGHQAPLALIVESRGLPPQIIAVISLFAVTNGALIQVIMASRVLYGLAGSGLAWRRFVRIHPHTRTPLAATATITIALMLFALAFPLGTLARATSFVALLIFCAVNLALLRLKSIGPPARFMVPRLVPACGFLLCAGMLIHEGLAL